MRKLKKNPRLSLEELKGIEIEGGDTDVDPKMQKLIERISTDKQEREWLKSLIPLGRFQEEDAYKLHQLLEDFHNHNEKEKRITDFKDDAELFDYLEPIKKKYQLQGREEKTFEAQKTEGVKLVDSDGDIDLYYVTSQAGLDLLGGGSNWCVVGGGQSYSPMEYCLFQENGSPLALMHGGTGQFMDSGDRPITGNAGLSIKLEKLFLDHNLSKQGRGEIGAYTSKLEEFKAKRKEVMENRNDEEFIKKEIDGAIGDNTISLVPEEVLIQYSDYFIQALKKKDKFETYDEDEDAGVLYSTLSDLNINFKTKLATDAMLHHKQDTIDILNKNAKRWLSSEDVNGLTIGRMRKFIPESLRTKEFMSSFKEKWRDIIKKYPPHHETCPFDEIKNDLEMWKEIAVKDPFYLDSSFPPSILAEVNKDKDLWKRILSANLNYREKCPIKEVLEDPEVWKKGLEKNIRHIKFAPEEVQNDPEVWRKAFLSDIKGPMNNNNNSYYEECPFEEVKNDPEVKAYAIKYWKDVVTKGPTKWAECPLEEVKNDPEVKANAIEHWRKSIPSRIYGASVAAVSRVYDASYAMDYERDSLKRAPSRSQESDLEKAFEGCPFDLKSDKELWKKIVKTNIFFYPMAPEEVQNDPEIKGDIVDTWKTMVKRDSTTWGEICPIEEINNDVNFWASLSNDVNYQKYPNQVFSSPDFWKVMVDKDIKNLQKCPLKEFQSDKSLWKRFVAKYPFLYEKCPFDEI